MVVLAGNIVGRYTGTLPMPWFDEIVAALFAWMVFIGAAALWREREHFAIDLVPGMVDGTFAGRPLRIFISLLGLIFALVLTWYGGVYMLKTTATTPILSFPQAWVYACVPVAGAVMIIYALRDFILSFRSAEPSSATTNRTQQSNPNQETDPNAV
jgi:TRAP-type C4-dicarboxylate transport system permease small subunit